jgi:DNA modification methylase
MPSVDLHLGDCLDAVVTDPPYGQANESYESDIAFRPELWAECFRVARPNAACISFAGSPTYHRIASAIEAGGWKVRQMWGWVYRDGMISSAWPKEGFDRLAPAFDPICYATKGKVLLNLEREGGGEWRRRLPRSGVAFSARSSNAGAALAGRGHWPKSIVSDGVEPFEYFAYRRARAEPNATGHPNQKPLSVMLWLVRKLPAGSVVLDPFAGSATTLEAAHVAGMDSIGIERDPVYHAIARRRIDAALNDAPLLNGVG